MAYILGIETSCDETAAAVFDTTEQRICSSELFSQIALHEKFGGVIPEVASRSHLEKIRPIILKALEQANISLSQLDAVAVTSKPGLAGSLLVGFTFAKSIAWSLKKPLISVNHLEGHIFSALLDDQGNFRELGYPHLCFSASGGHTALYIVRGRGVYEQIGHTKDDAAGEAFDKIAKLIGLGYPGGPQIERYAQAVEFVDYFFYPRNKLRPREYDFSFSGLKTAVMYDMVKRGYLSHETYQPTSELTKNIQEQVASSLLVCVGDIFENMIIRVLKDNPDILGLTFVGGVACNKYLRSRLNKCLSRRHKFFVPCVPRFCTDNAAMIALAGSFSFVKDMSTRYDVDIFE